MWKTEFQRAFLGIPFWLAVVIGTLLCMIGLSSYFEGPNVIPGAHPFYRNAYEAWLFAYAEGPTALFVILAPLLAVLPHADAYVMDRTTGYLRFVLLRVPRWRYFLMRLAVVALSGGIATALPLIITFGITNLMLPRGLPPRSPGELEPVSFLNVVYWSNPDVFVFIATGLAFLFGAVYATFGFAVSAYVDKRYLALVTPFVFYHVTNFVLAALGLEEWTPLGMWVPFGITTSTAFSVFAQLMLMLTATLLAFALRETRRSVHA